MKLISDLLAKVVVGILSNPDARRMISETIGDSIRGAFRSTMEEGKSDENLKDRLDGSLDNFLRGGRIGD